MQKQLLITFDYELFLGNRSGTVNECMIEPTEKLMSIMDKYGIHGVFFVDTTYLLRLHEQRQTNPACEKDFNKIASQLCSLVQNGHYVYPHIHPHWLDGSYLSEINQWRLNSTGKYRFTNITDGEKVNVFDGSVNILKSILHPQFPGYAVDAFRAGGWCIQPFTDFQPFFKKHNFKYEFSVLGGIYQFTDAQYFDFSNAPAKNIYRFSDDVCIENPEGNLIQFNISSLELSQQVQLLNKIWLKIRYKLFNDHTFHKGEGQPSKVLSHIKPVSAMGKDLGNDDWERVSVELMTSVKLNTYLNYFDQNSYMHFISHPKMVTTHNLQIFDTFLGKVFEKYSIETDFHMMNPE